jgi:hypothetical protein
MRLRNDRPLLIFAPMPVRFRTLRHFTSAHRTCSTIALRTEDWPADHLEILQGAETGVEGPAVARQKVFAADS